MATEAQNRTMIDLATRRVYSNHTFTIQGPVRERYSDALDIGDTITVYGETVDGEQFTVDETDISEGWRVYIGRSKAESYGLGEGGLAEITIVTDGGS